MAAKKYGLSTKFAYQGKMRCDVGDPSALVARADNTAYALGDYRRPATSNGWAYKCVTAGTSGSSAPTWPTVVDTTVTDGTCVWQAYSKGLVVVLATSSYTPDQDTHDYLSDVVTSYEASGTGYVRKYTKDTGTGNGMNLVSYTSGTNKTKIDFDDITWSALTSTFKYVIFAVDLGTDATSPLLSYDDIGAQNVGGVAFTYQINSAGVVEVTTS